MGGAPQPNAKGKFTRSGRVLGRSTPDVNDHYDFHEVRFKPNPPLDARAPSPRAERVSRLSRFASRTLADVSFIQTFGSSPTAGSRRGSVRHHLPRDEQTDGRDGVHARRSPSGSS